MEFDFKNSLTTYFGNYGLIFFVKHNEYYKASLPNIDTIKNIYDKLDNNPNFENLENKNNYKACCIYLLSRKDESYIEIFCKKIISSMSIKNDEIDDNHLSLIFNCIDFDENFMHSSGKKLTFLSVYLQKFSEYGKEEAMSLLFKYYNAILNYRIGQLESAVNECNSLIAYINNQSNDRIINFIKLKTQIFLAKIYGENVNPQAAQENSILLKDIYNKTINENPFLALKIGFSIFNNSYLRNQYQECIDILDKMLTILKTFENKGIPTIRMTRFYLSIFCRYGIIGFISSNREFINYAIEGIRVQLLLLKDNLSKNKIRHIFIAYNFSLNILKMNSGIYVDNPREKGDYFKKEFLDINNNDINNKVVSFCVNKEIIEQSIINYNAMNNNSNIEINEQVNKLVDEYMSRINNPEKNFISNNTIITFVIGLHDKVRYNIEQLLTNKDPNSVGLYQGQILSNCEVFWNFVNAYIKDLPILHNNFFRSISIKMFSSCFHIYFINKDFDNITQLMNYFDRLSNELNINGTTPSYELVLKAKGDLCFHQNDFISSIKFYTRSSEIMNDKDPKKGIIYFNLGVLNYYNNDKKRAIENLQKASEYFKKAEEEKCSFEFHKRNNALQKKFKITNAIIKNIQSN